MIDEDLRIINALMKSSSFAAIASVQIDVLLTVKLLVSGDVKMRILEISKILQQMSTYKFILLFTTEVGNKNRKCQESWDDIRSSIQRTDCSEATNRSSLSFSSLSFSATF